MMHSPFRHRLFKFRRHPTTWFSAEPRIGYAHKMDRFIAGDMALLPKAAKILVNGILCASPNDWQIPLCQWGNANAPQWSWNYFHYFADAVFAGWDFENHAQALADMIQKLLTDGAPYVDLVCHSEGNEVAVRAIQLGATVRNFNAVAAAMFADCRTGWWRNGLNDLIGGKVQQVRCFTSVNDGVLGGPLQWLTPYFWSKNFGLKGPVNDLPAGSYPQFPDPNQTHLSWFGTYGQSLMQKIVSLDGGPTP